MKIKNAIFVIMFLNISLIVHSKETEAIISDPNINNSFHERIKSVLWGGERYKITFEGVQQISETKLGSVEKWADGLAFHPNGEIAFSYGHGSTPNMTMAYWSSKGGGESVVNIQYAKRTEKINENKTEAKGYFWFFRGPIAFDPNGMCYFSLGSCQPNGIYKVLSNSPVEIEKLYSLGSTRSLQVPLFDKEHLYSTSFNGIFRYPIIKQKKPNEPWFTVHGEKILLSETLVINENEVIAQIVFMLSENASPEAYGIKSFLFDKKNNSYRVLSVDEIGPMAISWDGKRMIRYNNVNHTINEFSLVGK